MAHDFGDDDAVMTMGGAVEAVDGFSCNVQRGGKTKGRIGHGHVVVDGLGQSENIETFLSKAQCAFLRAAATEADEGIEAEFLVISDQNLGHIAVTTIDSHAMRFVAAGSENGASDGKDARQGLFIEAHAPIFGEAAEAVAETKYLQPVIADGGLADAPDGDVEAGAIPAGGQNTNALGLAHGANINLFLGAFEARRLAVCSFQHSLCR